MARQTSPQMQDPAQIEKLIEENKALKKEKIERDQNKPVHVAVVAEKYSLDKPFSFVTHRQLIEGGFQLPYILVADPNGGEVLIPVHPDVDPLILEQGRTVYVNGESMVIGTDGYYPGGEIHPFDRLLPDGRLVLRSDSSSGTMVCRSGHGINVKFIKQGDGIRHLGMVALENIGQSLNVDEYAAVPDKKEFAELVGENWKQIFNKVARKMSLLKKHNQTSDVLRRNLFIALWGLNGNGKTSGAKALIWYAAQQFGVENEKTLMVVKAGEIISKYIGQTQNNIANLFKKLREIQKEHGFAMLLIDEFDALCHGGDLDVESSWIRSSVVPQWKTELQGPVPLENTFIVVTLNSKQNVDAAILRRFKDYEVMAELDSIPLLVNQVITRECAGQKIDSDKIGTLLMHYLKSEPLGLLQFANKNYRDFYPSDIMSYADIEAVCVEAIENAEFDDRPISETDVIATASDLFREKKKRIRVGIENGIRRSNAREYFSNLSDEDFTNLDKVIVYEDKQKNASTTVSDEVEAL